MPEKRTVERATKAKQEGKAPTTQAGEFVREEMHHAEEGKHRVKSRKQAVAIGLSKARRAGVELKPPKQGSVSEQTRRKAQRDLEKGAEAQREEPERTASSSSRQRRETKH